MTEEKYRPREARDFVREGKAYCASPTVRAA